MDSEVENIRKTLQQNKSKICFINETNGRMEMTNKRLREDLEDINAHYQELIAVSKQELKRKREIQNQVEDLTKQIQNLNKQHEMLSNRVKSMETEKEWAKKQSHALEGISMLAEVSKQL